MGNTVTVTRTDNPRVVEWANLRAPVAVGQVEVTLPLAPQVATLGHGERHALLLIRSSGTALGVVILSAPGDADAADRLSAIVASGFDLTDIDASVPASAAAMPFISIVISTRNRPDLLERCLRSVDALEYPSYETIVVDNAPSGDATERLIAESFPTVHYVCEPEPGLAGAHNRGVATARGSIVAFTDDDVVVDGQWLSRIAFAFAGATDIGAVTGLIFPDQLDTEAQLLLERHGGFTKGFRTRAFGLTVDRPDDPLFPVTVGQVGSGANMAFDAELLREIGGFDPALGTGTPARGGDDLSGLLSVLLAGRRIVFEPSAIVHHRHRRELADLESQAEGYGVGLGAYLTSAFLNHPMLFVRTVPRLITGFRYAFAGDSARNAGRYDGWPPGLSRVERLGLIKGPLAYIRSRRQRRRSVEATR